MTFFEQPISPMEPRACPSLPRGEDYYCQVKWDGMRLKDKTAKYPELSPLAGLMGAEEFVLDGELIALTGGRPCFYSLMRREQRVANLKLPQVPVFYMVFDCLYLDGTWLLNQSWERRQEALTGMLQENENVRICESYADGESLLSGVQRQNLEGVVAKKKGSPYVKGPGKSPHWLKYKLEQQIQALVGGLLLRNGKAASLLLGLADGQETNGTPGGLRHIGSVSSGLTQKDLAAWQVWGRRHTLSLSPFMQPLSPSQGGFLWVEPLRSVTVTFNEWTPDLKLRAPRISKDASGAQGL